MFVLSSRTGIKSNFPTGVHEMKWNKTRCLSLIWAESHQLYRTQPKQTWTRWVLGERTSGKKGKLLVAFTRHEATCTAANTLSFDLLHDRHECSVCSFAARTWWQPLSHHGARAQDVAVFTWCYENETFPLAFQFVVCCCCCTERQTVLWRADVGGSEREERPSLLPCSTWRLWHWHSYKADAHH